MGAVVLTGEGGHFCAGGDLRQLIKRRELPVSERRERLEGLHDLSILVTTVDAARQGALGRFDARGVSFDNALKLAAHYLEGFAWTNGSKTK